MIRFDGVQFRRFDTFNGVALPDSFIDALFSAEDGSLWVGLRFRGICRIRNGHMRVYDEQDGFTTRSVKAIVEDPDGRWAATRNGLYYLQNDRWQKDHA